MVVYYPVTGTLKVWVSLNPSPEPFPVRAALLTVAENVGGYYPPGGWKAGITYDDYVYDDESPACGHFRFLFETEESADRFRAAACVSEDDDAGNAKFKVDVDPPSPADGTVDLQDGLEKVNVDDCLLWEGEDEADVSSCLFNDDDLRFLSKAVAANKTPRFLRFGDPEKGDCGARAADTRPFFTALAGNTSVTKVDMSWMEVGLGEHVAKSMADVLKANSTLREVDFDGSEIGTDGAVALATALETNSTLREVDFGGCEIGPDGAVALAKALEKNSSLQVLDLGYCLVGVAGAAAIGGMLRKNKTLRVLMLHGNDLGVDGARAIADGLKRNEFVTGVDLMSNEIGAAGARAVAEMLRVNRTVAAINLASNRIGEEGAGAIGAMLGVNRGLLRVYLAGNEIGDVGAQAVAEGLSRNGVVRKVDLAGNEIGDVGMGAVAEMLTMNSAVTEVELSSNRFGGQGLTAVARALRGNTAVRSVVLSSLANRPFGEEAVDAIAELLRSNNTLSTLRIECDLLGDDGTKRIKEVAEAHSDVLVPLTAEQRMAFLWVVGKMRPHVKLPLDVVKRILSLYKVNEGRRVLWDEGMGLPGWIKKNLDGVR